MLWVSGAPGTGDGDIQEGRGHAVLDAISGDGPVRLHAVEESVLAVGRVEHVGWKEHTVILLLPLG